ncbi:MAG: hypothetical protein IKE52_05770 [Mogibacterium sp.]|nr:hypothetical protein [Mogibacterium sp.]
MEMTLSVNQILVICLIIVLIALVIVLAIMAASVIELAKKSKAMVESGNKAVDDVKGRADEISDNLIAAIDNIATDTSPTIKALGAVAAGLTAINSVSAIGKTISIRSGLASSIAGSRAARNAKKTVKNSKKAVKQLKKQSRYEKKALKQRGRLEKIQDKAGDN